MCSALRRIAVQMCNGGRLVVNEYTSGRLEGDPVCDAQFPGKPDGGGRKGSVGLLILHR